MQPREERSYTKFFYLSHLSPVAIRRLLGGHRSDSFSRIRYHPVTRENPAVVNKADNLPFSCICFLLWSRWCVPLLTVLSLSVWSWRDIPEIHRSTAFSVTANKFFFPSPVIKFRIPMTLLSTRWYWTREDLCFLFDFKKTSMMLQQWLHPSHAIFGWKLWVHIYFLAKRDITVDFTHWPQLALYKPTNCVTFVFDPLIFRPNSSFLLEHPQHCLF